MVGEVECVVCTVPLLVSHMEEYGIDVGKLRSRSLYVSLAYLLFDFQLKIIFCRYILCAECKHTTHIIDRICAHILAVSKPM